MELDLATCSPLVLPILLPSWLSKWGITRSKYTHWSQKTGLGCVYRGRTFSEFYTVKLTRGSLGTPRNKKSPKLGRLPCSLCPFPLQIASCLASVVWFTWWFELQGHFAQTRFASEMKVLEIRLGQDDLWSLFQPWDSVTFRNSRRKTRPANDIYSFENFPSTAWPQVYLFCSSERWVFFKHVSGQPGSQPVYLTKRLVGLFELAHVRSLIVFSFFVFLLALTGSRRIKLCPSAALSFLTHVRRGLGTAGVFLSTPPHLPPNPRPCVLHQVSKYLFSWKPFNGLKFPDRTLPLGSTRTQPYFMLVRPSYWHSRCWFMRVGSKDLPQVWNLLFLSSLKSCHPGMGRCMHSDGIVMIAPLLLHELSAK